MASKVPDSVKSSAERVPGPPVIDSSLEGLKRWQLERQLSTNLYNRGSRYPPFSIQPMPYSAQRTAKLMTEEERFLRKQWLQDQILAADEPKFVEGAKPMNNIRKFYKAPWDAIERQLRTVMISDEYSGKPCGGKGVPISLQPRCRPSGNDIKSQTMPRKIKDDVFETVKELEEHGIKTCVFQSSKMAKGANIKSPNKAEFIRKTVPRTMILYGVLVYGYYQIRFNHVNWERVGGLHLTGQRKPRYGEPGEENIPIPTFGDGRFSERTVLRD